MFNQTKALQLENKSHVRGRFAKELYSSEQEELERKRREMKSMLDKQVEEKKIQKYKQKRQQQEMIRKQQQINRQYLAQLALREKSNTTKDNESSSFATDRQKLDCVHNRPNLDSDYKNREIGKKEYRDLGDIPVMPVMQGGNLRQYLSKNNSESNAAYRSNPHKLEKNRENLRHADNIPLLQLSQKQYNQISQIKQRRKVKSKASFRKNQVNIGEQPSNRKRRVTLAEQKTFLQNSRYEIDLKSSEFGDLNSSLEEQNQLLKRQLKRNKQAMSLLIGAISSNNKLDKFRLQAQKILSGGHVSDKNKRGSKKLQMSVVQQQKSLILPQIKLRNQSIMHDYLFGLAKKGHALYLK